MSKKDCGCNVGEIERVISAVGGGVMVVKGLSRGSTFGILTAALGAASLYRAATGHCALYRALNINTNTKSMKLSNVTDHAKIIAANAADRAQELTNEARQRASEALAVK